MPLLQIHLTTPSVAQDVLNQIHVQSADLLAEQIGKSVEYVMVLVRTGESISFAKDNDTPCAYMEVKNVGELSSDLTEQLTSKLSNLLNEILGVTIDRIYVDWLKALALRNIPHILVTFETSQLPMGWLKASAP